MAREKLYALTGPDAERVSRAVRHTEARRPAAQPRRNSRPGGRAPLSWGIVTAHRADNLLAVTLCTPDGEALEAAETLIAAALPVSATTPLPDVDAVVPFRWIGAPLDIPGASESAQAVGLLAAEYIGTAGRGLDIIKAIRIEATGRAVLDATADWRGRAVNARIVGVGDSSLTGGYTAHSQEWEVLGSGFNGTGADWDSVAAGDTDTKPIAALSYGSTWGQVLISEPDGALEIEITSHGTDDLTAIIHATASPAWSDGAAADVTLS